MLRLAHYRSPLLPNLQHSRRAGGSRPIRARGEEKMFPTAAPPGGGGSARIPLKTTLRSKRAIRAGPSRQVRSHVSVEHESLTTRKLPYYTPTLKPKPSCLGSPVSTCRPSAP